MSKLDLQMYARVLAHVACRRGAPLGGILAELGIEATAFADAEAGLRDEIAGLWDNRKGIVAMRFAAALGAELKRLGPLGGEGTGATQPTIVAIPSAAPEVRGTDLPSYLQEPLAGAFATPSSVSYAPVPTMFVDTDIGVAAPTLASPPAFGAGAPSHNPVSAVALPAVAPLHGTADMDLSAIVAAVKRGALPFGPGSNAEPLVEAHRTPDPQPTAPSGPGETINADLSAIVSSAKQGGLPWKRDEVADAARSSDDGELARLPLAAYAEICGALARGESRDAALSKRGLSSEAFGQLARLWSERLQRDPELMVRFKDLVRSCMAGGPRET